MEGILRAVCPDKSQLWPGTEDGDMDGAENPDSHQSAVKTDCTYSNNIELRLKTVRNLKHALVGNEGPKVEAIRLGIVRELLSFLDAAAADGTVYESSILQAMGLFSILTTSPAASEALVPFYSKLLGHVREGLGFQNERTTVTTLKMMNELHAVLLRRGGSLLLMESAGNEIGTTGGTESVIPLLLTEISLQVLNEVTNGLSWSPALRTLGCEALALVTKDGELAGILLPAVVSTGTTLLRPILPPIRYRANVSGFPDSPRVETRRERTILPVLEVLLNLSTVDSAGVASWLTNCTPGWLSLGALKGLEMQLNSRDEKARILAGLVLMNCFKGRRRGSSSSSSTGNTPSNFTSVADDQPQNAQQEAVGYPCQPDPASPHALDAVIDHRVLPLFLRMLCSGGSSSIPSMTQTSSTNKHTFLSPFHGHTVDVVGAVNAGIRLRSWHRQGETASYGAVDSLVSFLRTARKAAKASSMASSAGGYNELKEMSPFRQGAEMSPLIDAARAALDAVGIMCASCEAARERVVALGFHSDVAIWLAEEVGAMEGTGNSSGVLLEGLRLVRNLGRSSVPCSSIIGVGALETLIKVVAIVTVENRGEENEGEGEESRVATEGLALAVAGLANMVLEHDVVKEAISRSECLRTVSKTAVDASAPEHVRMACVALLSNTCFLSPLHIRLTVSCFLNGVEGMLALLDVPRDSPLLVQTLQALRNLLQAVPLWSLYRGERQPSPEQGDDHGIDDETPVGTIAIATAAAASYIASVEERERAVLYSSGRSGQGDWRGWESRYPEQRNIAARRHYWGGLEIPPVPRTGFHSSIQNGSPESMDVEMEFQSDRGSHQGTVGGMGSWMGQGRGEEAAAAGFIKLVDVVLGKLDGAPSGDGCDETTCAALRLLHTLAAADESQRTALQTPRVFQTIMPHLMPDDASQLLSRPAPTSIPVPTTTAPTDWRTHPRTRSRRRRDRRNVSSHDMPAPLPPRVTADIAARMLLGQLLPEQTTGNAPTMFAMLPATVGALPTSSSSASSDSASAVDAGAVRGGGQGTRGMPAAAWFGGVFDHHGERRTGGE